mgnify:CR=1 FL=1
MCLNLNYLYFQYTYTQQYLYFILKLNQGINIKNSCNIAFTNKFITIR